MPVELLGCDLDNADAIRLLEKCEKENITLSQKIQTLIQNFFTRGDYHLLKKETSF